MLTVDTSETVSQIETMNKFIVMYRGCQELQVFPTIEEILIEQIRSTAI